MATGTGPTRLPTARGLRIARNFDLERVGLSLSGGVACVVITVALAAGHVAGTGPQIFGAALFVLVAAWCFGRRRVDHTLALLALYLGLLDGYVKLRTGSSTVTLARDVLVVAIAAGALLRASTSGQRLALPPLGGLVLAFCAIVIVGLANPNARNLAGGLAGVRQHLEFVPLFFLGFAFLRRESHVRIALLLLVSCAAIGGVVSFIQSTLTPQELADWGPGYSERIIGLQDFTGAGRTAIVEGVAAVRPFGLGADAGAGALLAAIALPSLIALVMVGPNRYRLFVLPLAIGVALALATSGSRTPLLVAFVALLAFGVVAATSRNALRAIIGLAIGTLLVYGTFVQLSSDNAATKRTQSIVSGEILPTYREERGASLALLGKYIKEYPLGAGVGRQGPASGTFAAAASTQQLNAETQWNFLVLETGILGLGVYLLLNLRILTWTITRIRPMQSSRQRLYLAALAAPLAGLIAQGFAGPTTVSVPAAPYFWLIAGLLSYWLAGRPQPLTSSQAGSQ